MITKWKYGNLCGERENVKEIIKKLNYISVDVGGSVNCWSYPECKTYMDIKWPHVDDEHIKFHRLNLESDVERNEFIKLNIKYDYSICSHTLEDLFNPVDVIKFLTQISKRGYIAVPSKYNEFRKLYDNKYRGNAHHKQILDVKNDKIIIYPKFSFIETDERSELFINAGDGDELTIFWENDIECEVFGNGVSFTSDSELISKFYDSLLK